MIAASVYMLVSPLGCFLGGVLLEKIGRRSGVLLGQVVYIIGWTLIAAAQSSVMLICGRILDGIAVGIVSSAGAVRNWPLLMRELPILHSTLQFLIKLSKLKKKKTKIKPFFS